MEILIPGLVLVGFMIWASTRIKRNAAQAFEREEIERPDFSIVKPEGFLAPVDPADGTIFSAYSKDFGTDGAASVRRATVEMLRHPGANFDEVRERVKEDSAVVRSEENGVIGGRKCANIVVERAAGGVAVESFHKILAAPNAVYQLVVTVLPEYSNDFSRSVDELTGSFALTQDPS